MVYYWVKTKHPSFFDADCLRLMPNLAKVMRTKRAPSYRKITLADLGGGIYVPYLVEDVLHMVVTQWQIGRTPPPPECVDQQGHWDLPHLNYTVIDSEFIVPAIEASRAEGPEEEPRTFAEKLRWAVGQ